MNHPRERYNALARRSSAGLSRKKGKRQKTIASHPSETCDTNVAIHKPKTEDEKELEKKERLRREVGCSIHQPDKCN